jgi:anti-anti-sigma factor
MSRPDLPRSETPPFVIRTLRLGEVRIVAVAGEVDMVSAPAFLQALESARGSSRVVVDLTEVEFFDSSGVAALVRAHQTLSGLGIELRVVAPPAALARRVLEITRLGDLFPVEESRAAALA